MTEKEAPKPKHDPHAPKKRWERPRIKTGKLFEMNSLACAKFTGRTCRPRGAGRS